MYAYPKNSLMGVVRPMLFTVLNLNKEINILTVREKKIKKHSNSINNCHEKKSNSRLIGVTITNVQRK